MVAEYEIDSAIQTVKHLRPLGSTTQAEIAQVKNNIALPDVSCNSLQGLQRFAEGVEAA